MLDFTICSPGSVLVNFRVGFRVTVPIDTASQVKHVLFLFKCCVFLLQVFGVRDYPAVVSLLGVRILNYVAVQRDRVSRKCIINFRR